MNETSTDAKTEPGAAEQLDQRTGLPWFSNKEWLVLLTAIAVAIAGITAAALDPDRSVASAAPSEADVMHASTDACPLPPSTEATVLASSPTTPTSDVATESASAVATTAANTANIAGANTASANKTTVPKKAKTSKKSSTPKKPQVVEKKPTKPAPTPPTTSTPSLLSVGSLINFGSHNGAPLRWRVLDANGNELFLLSEYILSAGAFQSDWEGGDAASYSASEVRAWLQNDFAPQAFNTQQNAALLAHGGAGSDRVFLLSVTELKHYLPETADRKAAPCSGAGQVGFSGEALSLSGGCAAWWLADAASDGFSAQVIEPDGKLGDKPVYYADLGVRPAIRVDRNKIAFALDAQEGD